MRNNMMSFLLTTIAGLSTMLGTIPIFVRVKNIPKLLASVLAFASGVMLTVSITDLIPESIDLIGLNNGNLWTIILCLFFMMVGIIVSMLIDYYLPTQKIELDNKKQKTLYRVGIISMVAIILHNLPEGMATFITTNNNMTLGISLTIAIALHNIPEGISISVPIYYATKSKSKALLYTFISALSEPLGALIAFLFLAPFVTETLLGILFAIIAGIMIQISLCELLPTSLSYEKKKTTIIFLILGCIFMLAKFFI